LSIASAIISPICVSAAEIEAVEAVGAGLAVNVDQVTHQAHGITQYGTNLTVTVPVALFLLVLWLLHGRRWRAGRLYSALLPATALLVLATIFIGTGGGAVLATGLLMAASVVVALATKSRSDTVWTA
jgi:hypothetical protein